MGQPHLSHMPPSGSSECPVQPGSASGTVPPGRNPSRTGGTDGRSRYGSFLSGSVVYGRDKREKKINIEKGKWYEENF